MNAALRAVAEGMILTGLAQLNDGCQHRFRQMYERGGVGTKPLAEIVSDMPAEKIDNCLDQIQRSLKKPELLKA